jgi:hypothetical protein
MLTVNVAFFVPLFPSLMIAAQNKQKIAKRTVVFWQYMLQSNRTAGAFSPRNR